MVCISLHPPASQPPLSLAHPHLQVKKKLQSTRAEHQAILPDSLHQASLSTKWSAQKTTPVTSGCFWGNTPKCFMKD